MPARRPLQPTLWRSCRALANRKRLSLLALLIESGPETPSGISRRVRESLALTSQYLRNLEARGMLEVKRESRWVFYSVPVSPPHEPAAALVPAMRSCLHSPESIEETFKLLTAFTHPRRI